MACFNLRSRGQGVSSDAANPRMGRKPIFCMAKDTVVDMANKFLPCNTPDLPHRLDDMAEVIVRGEPQTLKPALAGLSRDPYLRRSSKNTATYVDIFVDNFIELAQGTTHQRRQVRQILFHSLDNVFRPCESIESDNRK